MDNMSIYTAVRKVPDDALKPITGGRLKGKTDINPMWRIKALTEQFGPCGFGWKYRITDKRLEAGAKGEVAAFVDIDLFVKVDGEWSEAIPGTGGSAFVTSEKSSLYTSDECFKMALTDAISVACKALGFAADVYWDKDRTKYSGGPQEPPKGREDAPKEGARHDVICADCGKPIRDAKNRAGEVWKAQDIVVYAQLKHNRHLCISCLNRADAGMKAAANG